METTTATTTLIERIAQATGYRAADIAITGDGPKVPGDPATPGSVYAGSLYIGTVATGTFVNRNGHSHRCTRCGAHVIQMDDGAWSTGVLHYQARLCDGIHFHQADADAPFVRV